MTKFEHNILHWLMVVILRIVYLFFWLPISYFIALTGLIFSEKFIVLSWVGKLPGYQVTKILVTQWFQSALDWRAIVIGVPMIIMGISIFLIIFFNLFHSLSSLNYNRTHCPLCKT